MLLLEGSLEFLAEGLDAALASVGVARALEATFGRPVAVRLAEAAPSRRLAGQRQDLRGAVARRAPPLRAPRRLTGVWRAGYRLEVLGPRAAEEAQAVGQRVSADPAGFGALLLRELLEAGAAPSGPPLAATFSFVQFGAPALVEPPEGSPRPAGASAGPDGRGLAASAVAAALLFAAAGCACWARRRGLGCPTKQARGRPGAGGLWPGGLWGFAAASPPPAPPDAFDYKVELDLAMCMAPQPPASRDPQPMLDSRPALEPPESDSDESAAGASFPSTPSSSGDEGGVWMRATTPSTPRRSGDKGGPRCTSGRPGRSPSPRITHL